MITKQIRGGTGALSPDGEIIVKRLVLIRVLLVQGGM